MSSNWTDVPIHFVDFEGNRASGILEYGVASLEGGGIARTRTRLCGATSRVRPEDTAVHGLRPDDVAAHAPLADDWEYFAGLREQGPLAAHYAATENSLLKSVWPYPRASPDFARPGGTVAEWGPWIDTGRLYAQLQSPQSSGKLEELVATAGLPARLDSLASAHCPPARRHYHAALYDALAGALLLQALLSRPEFTAATIPWLLQMSTLDPEKRDALRQRKLF
ncbi:MAG: DNA polymerase III subunit epsilon [Verrucomicrobia bacterium RIFCSPLOWO2_12_FULL_64_8]|nr:MAG: DNA polymerase III subunit epsilon [Verrucomicrobia bacterium RIFCSPLOWO2_12_FULL_64_8]